MSDTLQAIILGIIQGLTEFLPVSSSGHIELAKYIFGEDAVGEEAMLMTVILHFATALSTVVVFRKYIAELLQNLFRPSGVEERKFAINIIISMIPAALVGVLMEDFLESLFNSNIVLVSCCLILTGLLLFVADKARTTDKDISPKHAVIIGIAQAIAILPGVSRSGATICTTVLLGIDREKAARFSFLMVIPLIFGKIAKDLLTEDISFATISPLDYTAGFIAAFVSGILACTWMISLVKRSNLKYFSYYCFIVAAIGLIYTAV